jgi:hypothetical protein
MQSKLKQKTKQIEALTDASKSNEWKHDINVI